MLIESLTFNAFEENTYILIDETGKAAIVDPGCYEREEEMALKQFVEQRNLSVQYVLNTHCHVDHVLGNEFAKVTFKAPLLIPAHEQSTLRSVKTYAPSYGFAKYRESEPDGFLNEGDRIQLGATQLDILFLPGHSAGHIGLYDKVSGQLVSGDVLFYHSIGRTDLPGGHHQTLLRNIQQKLFVLPEEVVVYPGHGQVTTIGEEKINNPFCAITV